MALVGTNYMANMAHPTTGSNHAIYSMPSGKTVAIDTSIVKDIKYNKKEEKYELTAHLTENQLEKLFSSPENCGKNFKAIV